MGEAVATLKGPGPGPADGTKTLDGVDAALGTGTGTDTDVGKDVGIDEATAAPAPEIPNILPPLLSFRSNNALEVTGPPTPPPPPPLAFPSASMGAAILTKSFLNASTFPPTSPAASIAAEVV